MNITSINNTKLRNEEH